MYYNTPWGKPDFCAKRIPGIVQYYTPSHGGIHLSKKRIAQLPLCIKREHNWLRDFRWWEEDCDASIVRVIFAKELYKAGVVSPKSLVDDMNTVRTYQPELYDELYVSLKLNDAYDVMGLW